MSAPDASRPLWVDEPVIAFAGDWHGFGSWGAEVVRAVGAAGIRMLHHVGDFGVWPGEFGRDYLAEISDAAVAAGVDVWITPGNHEDWSVLDALFAEHGDQPAPIADRLWLLPRGYRWEQGGRSWVSLGGAPTLSFERRTVGVDWWPSEAITEDHVALVASGGHADAMITHDTPRGGTDEAAAMIADNPFGFSARAQAYAETGQDLLTRAFEAVRPAFLVHGHYHVHGMADRDFTDADGATWRTRFLTLDRERRVGNAVVVDARNWSVTDLDVEVPDGGFVPPPFMR